MQDLFIEGTDSLPSVGLKTNGKLKIEGRALPENAHQFFQPVIAWAKEFSHDNIQIDINLEYFNTSVSKQLLDFLKVVEDNPANKKITIVWHYEEGDDEMQESGEIYEELLPRSQFIYNQYEEILD